MNFDDELTEIIGPNATGKTNILEAIFVALGGSSFRAKDADLIRYGEAWAVIVLETDIGTIKATLDTRSGRLVKKRFLDGKPIKTNETIYPVVLFEPDFIRTFTAQPELRRSWLDQLIAISDRAYSSQLEIYNRALRQRNALLKQPRIPPDHLFVWNVKLADTGAYLSSKRADFVEQLNTHITGLYNNISTGDHLVEAIYEPQISPGQNYQSLSLKILEQDLEKDRARGYTGSGPHRDDLLFLRDNQDLSTTGSRGEQRTLSIACKHYELMLLETLASKPPILLLDDITSELDASRAKAVSSFQKNHQTILTSTG